MTRRYYFKASELANIYSELEKYGQVPSARTVVDRNRNIKQWARENGIAQNVSAIADFSQNYINTQEMNTFLQNIEVEEEIDTPEWMQNIDVPSDEEIENDIVDLTRNSLLRLLDSDIKERSKSEYLVLKLKIKVYFGEQNYNVFIIKNKYIPLVDTDTINRLKEQLTKNIMNEEDMINNNFSSDPVMSTLPDIKTILGFDLEQLNENSDFVKQNWRSRRGHFFNYFAIAENEQIINTLKRCQIFVEMNDENKELLNETCLLYALRQAGISQDILTNMNNYIINNYVQAVKFDRVFREFDLHGKIREIGLENRTRTIVNTGNDFVINLFKEHYFLEFNTGMTASWVVEALKNPYTEIKSNFRKHGNRWVKDNKRTIMSSELVQLLDFTEMKFSDLENIPTENKLKLPNSNLDYNEKYCCKELIENKKPRGFHSYNPSSYFVADFETDPTKKHIPEMCNLKSIYTQIDETFIGMDCGEKLLDYLPDKSIVYFHNSSYDINFLTKYIDHADVIRKGMRTISATLYYKGKTIIIRDFLTLINMALEKLPQFFHLKQDIKKEKFPYKYYTYQRFMRGIGEIDKAYLKERPTWTEEDIKQFIENIDSIDGCRIDDNHFDMKKYCEFYCAQDVNILKESFKVCRELMLKSFNIDIINFLTTPAIANYCLERDVLNKPNIYKYGGKVKDYLSRAIYGGRCMCAWNKKWHTYCRIYDLDVCSLYPSAMARMFIPYGKPKVLTTEQCTNKEFLKSCDFYVATIHIKSVPKHRAFSLIPQRTRTGIKWSDYLPSTGLTQEFSSIFIEDLEKFYPGIEYEVLRGYYWNEGKDYSIQKFIKNIYRKRGVYKLIKEPINEMYKLIMNSAYGKTIQKFIKTTTKLIQADKIEDFVRKHNKQIIDYEEVDGGKSFVVNMIKDIDNQFTAEHVGIIVLDMSKRIMNEVMCLAEDNGIRIYYQDTDSMHIEVDAVDTLAKLYEKEYNRPMLKQSIKLDKTTYTIDDFDELDAKYGDLVEQEMGKFHDDFDSNKGKVLYAQESIFIRKKMYFDELLLDNGGIDYQYRMKGIPQKCIALVNDVKELYKNIYSGISHTFNLLDVKPCFKQSRNYTISSVEQFKRKVESVYDEGNVEHYFNYGQ